MAISLMEGGTTAVRPAESTPWSPLPTGTPTTTAIAPKPPLAPAQPAWMPEYRALQESERQSVTQQFSEARQGLQTDIHKRGMGRSGFSAESMSKLGAKEGSALADVEAGLTDRLMNYKFQQEQLALQRAAMAKAKKKNKKKKKLGAALGVAGIVLAPFTGGASLSLTAAGAGMYMG